MPPSSLTDWIDAWRRRCDMEVRPIGWADSREWAFDGAALHHATGRFFRVVGARRPGLPDQPLIDQPEVGILGFLLRRRGGRRELCVQAKPEPGTMGLVQAAPTVQATESNYECVHGGRPTPLLDAFLAPGRVLSDSHQSEQGSRFLNKWNRNVVVEADAEADDPALSWLDLGDVLAALGADYVVNTDARSVLATCPWEALADAPFGRWRGRGGLGEALLRSYGAPGTLSDDEVEGRLAAVAAPETTAVGLPELAGWAFDAAGLGRPDGTGFRVAQFAVTTTQREVARWDQPLLAARAPGQAALLGRERDGALEFAFRARHEIGFRGPAQLGPTTQDAEPVPPSRQLVGCLHSDEGGRFYRSAAHYSLRLAADAGPDDPAVVWLTLGQVARRIGRPGAFTNEARSLVSLALAYL